MPDPAHLLVASATVERLLGIAAALAVVVLLLRAWRSPAPSGVPLVIGVRAERAAMVAVLAWVLATRLVGLVSPQHPRVYFAEASVVFIADTLATKDPGRHWLSQLGNVQVLSEHESPIQAPVAGVLQRLLGPSIELPSIAGTVWAVVAVLLAWRVGRALETPAFGILFAAMVAVSPLQMAWAHIGGIHIGAPVGVLFALWIGWLAGRRGGIALAGLTGVVAWSSVYYYFAARVGMVLAFVALWAGWRRSGRRPGRLGGLMAAAGAGLAACVVIHALASPGQGLWPAVQGYVGSSGETGAADWLRNAAAAIREQAPRAFRAYFWSERLGSMAQLLAVSPSRWVGSLLEPGMSNGGLVVIPVLALGAIGLAGCLRHPIERGVWLALAVGGLLPPIVAPPTARRFLVFDIAWAAFAARGLLWLLESRLLAPAAASRRWQWGGIVLAGIGCWSAAAIALSWSLLPGQQVRIPFADSGIGDECTCLGCVRTGRIWQRELAEGRMVVLVDSDAYRENGTCPGALPLYGKIAALAAATLDRFVDYYTIPSNVDWFPPHPGQVSSGPPDDVAGALAARIDAAKPSAIVWWFSQPNAWERRMADVLVQAGSTRTNPRPEPLWGADRPIVDSRPIRVETPWERRHEALAALRALVDPTPPPTCVKLEHVATRSHPKTALLLAPMPDREGPPEWVVGSFDGAPIWGVDRQANQPSGLAFFRGADGRLGAALVDFGGRSRVWTADGREQAGSAVPGPRPLGRDCLVLHKGQWWAVDPVAGTVHAPGDPLPAAPPGIIGIAALDDRLVLATADQQLHVLDPATRQIVHSFPAAVVPARRFQFGECAMLASGTGWIASLDQMRGVLFFYDPDGTPLGRIRLGPSIPNGPATVLALSGTGDYLGVGHGTTVTTLRVVRSATCVRADSGAGPARGAVDHAAPALRPTITSARVETRGGRKR